MFLYKKDEINRKKGNWMPNYYGVLDDIESVVSKARSVLQEGLLSAYMEYYRQELNESRYLKEVTVEVNEACEIALTEALTSLKCYASFESRRYEQDDVIAFEIISEIMGSLGVIEIPNSESHTATLFIKKDLFSKCLKDKTVEDLEEYTKLLKKVEKELQQYEINVQFV
jgi:hypothetical protein